MDEIEHHLINFLRISREEYARVGLTRVIANVCQCAQLTFKLIDTPDSTVPRLSFTSAMTIDPLCLAAAAYIARTTSTPRSPHEIKLELEGLVGGWLLESQPRQQDYPTHQGDTKKPKLVAQP